MGGMEVASCDRPGAAFTFAVLVAYCLLASPKLLNGVGPARRSRWRLEKPDREAESWTLSAPAAIPWYEADAGVDVQLNCRVCDLLLAVCRKRIDEVTLAFALQGDEDRARSTAAGAQEACIADAAGKADRQREGMG